MRLSELQVSILLELLRNERETGHAKYWQPGRWKRDWDSSKAASVSRSLRRLEARGLIVREDANRKGFKRTTHVRLTERGRAVVQRLLS